MNPCRSNPNYASEPVPVCNLPGACEFSVKPVAAFLPLWERMASLPLWEHIGAPQTEPPFLSYSCPSGSLLSVAGGAPWNKPPAADGATPMDSVFGDWQLLAILALGHPAVLHDALLGRS